MSARRAAAGAVLAGGASRRMGRDKARLEFQGATLLDRALSCLAECRPLFVASGATPRYADIAVRHGAREVLDDPALGEGAGPLAGIAAALDALRAFAGAPHRLVVLACDLPHVTVDAVLGLLERAEGADVAFATSLDGDHPLFGVYDLACLVPLRRALAAGHRSVVSLLRPDVQGDAPLVVRRIDARELSVDPHLLANLNDPSQLAAERRRATAPTP